MKFNVILLLVYVAYMVIMSLIAIGMYCADKKKAIKGQMRTKEKNLLLIAVLGGSIGAFFGRLIAHHKTDKVYFSIVIYISLLLQIATLGILAALAVVL